MYDEIAVTAYSGSRGEETPRSFTLFGEQVEVIEIVERWVEEDFLERKRRRFFRVRGGDGYTHILCHDEIRGTWSIRKSGPKPIQSKRL